MLRRNPWSIYCISVGHPVSLEITVILDSSRGQYNIKLLFLGVFDLKKDFLLVNHILLLAEYFIYKCKLSQVIPSLLVFKAKLSAT